MHEPGISPHENLPARGPWGERLFKLSKLFALAGGAIFIALVAMSIMSIVGRKLFLLPVPGDIEIMQMGTAVAAAALLAYCEMSGSHLKVDFFTSHLNRRAKARMDGVAHLLMALVALLVAWRTMASAIASRESGETSLMLGWPVWWAIAAIAPSLVLLAAAAAYNAVQKFQAPCQKGEFA